MPLYYLNDNLNVAGTHRKMFTVQGLWELKQKSRDELVERGLIREVKTLPVSNYEQFQEYAIMIENAGYETLGDFAGANPGELPDELQEIQLEAIAFLHPSRPAGIPEKDCCG